MWIFYGSHNCDYEEYYILRRDAVQFGNFWLLDVISQKIL
jgi:hypothetical protein